MPEGDGARFVDTTYAEHDGGKEYKRLLEESEVQKKCLFCHLPPENKVVHRGEKWTLFECKWPYENSDGHFILIPNRHITELDDISSDDFEEVKLIVRMAREKYPTLGIGGGLAIRFGTNSGLTIYHAHFHLIAPKTDPATGKVVPGKHVNFPIG